MDAEELQECTADGVALGVELSELSFDKLTCGKFLTMRLCRKVFEKKEGSFRG